MSNGGRICPRHRSRSRTFHSKLLLDESRRPKCGFRFAGECRRASILRDVPADLIKAFNRHLVIK